MKKFYVLFMCLFLAVSVSASEWTKSLNLAVTLNQSKSKSGVAEGSVITEKSTLNYGIIVNGDLTKDNTEINWKNTLKLEYARSRNTEKNDGTYTSTPSWTEDIDQLTIDSVYRWKLSKYLNPYVAANIQTAVLDISGAPTTAFRPIQFRESGGIGSPIIEEKDQTLVARAGFYIQHNENTADNAPSATSNGIELVLDYKNQLKKDTLFTSKLGFYTSLKDTPDPANWGNSNNSSKKIKMEWDNTLITKITEYINITFSYNVDNVDVTESKAHYEWEQKFNLAFNYKVF